MSLRVPDDKDIQRSTSFTKKLGKPGGAGLVIDADGKTVAEKLAERPTTEEAGDAFAPKQETAEALGERPTVADLAESTMASNLGTIGGNVQADLDTLRERAIDPRDPPFNAKGDGTTDDAAALQAALTAAGSRKVELRKGVTYAIGSQLTVPEAGGFVGGGKLLMLTGTGKFSTADYSLGDPWSNIGVYALGRSNVIIECEVEMQAHASTRTCSPIAVRNCINAQIDVDVHGFAAARVPLVAWDSNVGGSARVRAWDCVSGDNSLTLQITGFCVDANRVGGVNSIGLTFDVWAKNLMVTGAAAQAQGYQSDACNIQTQGYAGFVGRVYGEKVGEILDIFADGCVIDVVAKDAYEYGVKMIHGAENNVIRATVNGFRRHALVFGGSNSAPKSVKRNRVYLTAARGGDVAKSVVVASTTSGSPTITVSAVTSGMNIAVGDVIHDSRFPAGTTISAIGSGTGGTGTYTASQNANVTSSATLKTSPAPTAAVATDGSSATYKPTDNYVEVSYSGDGVGLDYGVWEQSGSRNAFKISGSGEARRRVQIDSTAGQGSNASRCAHDRKTFVRAYAGTASTPNSIAPGAFYQIQYATELADNTGEFDPATYTFTANSERDLIVNASGRTGGAGDQKIYDLQLRKNGTEIFRKQCRTSGVGDFSFETGPVLVHVSPGDTITAFLKQDESGTIYLTNSEAFSRLHIWEV